MQPALLGSWKEIAVFLDRGVRTIQRWELKQGMPVHRVGPGSKAPVFAFQSEIQDWLHTQPSQISAALKPTDHKREYAVHVDIKAMTHQRELRVIMRGLLKIHRQRISELRTTTQQLLRRGTADASRSALPAQKEVFRDRHHAYSDPVALSSSAGSNKNTWPLSPTA